MNFKEKLKAVKTFDELIDLRKEIVEYGDKYSALFLDTNINRKENLRQSREADFWEKIVENRIEKLELEGHKLDKIKPLKKK